jgi:hypothetical protein
MRPHWLKANTLLALRPFGAYPGSLATTRERQAATGSLCSSMGSREGVEKGDSFPLLPAFQAVWSLKKSV